MQATIMFDISLTQPVVDNVKPVSKLILPHAEVARLSCCEIQASESGWHTLLYDVTVRVSIKHQLLHM